ncbi:MAG TPA: VOC family protein [Chryseolinea sp.]
MKTATISAIILLTSHLSFTQHSQTTNTNNMTPIDNVYTVFITKNLSGTVSFYEQYFGFTKIFESTFFVLLQSSGEQKFNIAFMDEEHPTAPPSPKTFNGNGSFLTLEVADAEALYKDLKKRGLTIAYQLKDEPWGQKRFAVIDPNNLWVDVVQQTQPVEGFWDRYMK